MNSKLAPSVTLPLWFSTIGLLALGVLTMGFARAQDERVDDPTQEAEPEWPVTSGAAPGYVPESACVECHEERLHSFQHSPMSQSFFAATPESLPKDLSESAVYHEPSGNFYEIVQREGEVFQRRWRIGANGKRYAEFERRIDWVMGSGTHAQTYCYQTPSGEIFQMPLGWYRGPGFAMSPGYDFKDHKGFQRPISRRCMFCHNDFGEMLSGSDEYGELMRYSPETLPEGISCQRCHGPGAAHASLALDLDASDADIRAAIVHPAQVELERSNDICFQCHLQPSASVEDTVRRLGRGTNSFKPGEDLREYNAHFDIFDDASVTDRFEINHQAYRLLQSACFVGSEGTMGCISCHSPHDRPKPEERPEYYRRKCLQCHEPDACTSENRFDEHEGVADDCARCHMPERRTQDVVLATATEHRIRREAAPDSFLDPILEEDGFKTAGAKFFFDESKHGDSENALYQAMFQLRNGKLGGLAPLANLISVMEPKTAEPYIDLGNGYLSAGRPAQAAVTFELLTVEFPDRSIGWRSLAQALNATGRSGEATRAAKRAVKLEPNHPDNHFTLARVHGVERLKPALESYRDGLALRPNDDKAFGEMGKLLMERGRVAQAAVKFENAIAASPRKKENYDFLGDARAELGQWELALEAWARGLEFAEYDSILLRKLAFGYLTVAEEELRDPKAALEYARTAEVVTPRDADVATVIALALVELDQNEEALVAIQRAEGLRADPAVTHGLRAFVSESLGRKQDAENARRAVAEAQKDRNVASGALRDFVLERLNASSTR